MELRVGIGYDAHALEEGVPLVLGGVAVDYSRGLAGHSDGDVLAHALIDAILGAANLGDIGSLFPSGDERYRGASSLDLLRVAYGEVRQAGIAPLRVGAFDFVSHAREDRYRNRPCKRPIPANYSAAIAYRRSPRLRHVCHSDWPS